MKYDNCIWFESVTAGIQWFIGTRGMNKRTYKRRGYASTYDEAVRASEAAFWTVELPRRIGA